MWGYFGSAYFGGAVSTEAVAPSADTRLAADAASVLDWDVTTAGLGSDETATATDVAVATGLNFVSTRTVTDAAAATDVAVATGLGATPPPPTPTSSLIRFVNSVSTGAIVRMELESAYWTVLQPGTSTPPPAMRDQRSASMLADGDLIAASVYENRHVVLALLLQAPTPAIAATEIQKLQRELDRATNVLWWQPDVRLPPVFFRTYRGPDVTVDMDFGISVHKFSLDIEAEPFALGAPVSVGTITVNHDPALGTNPCYFDVTNVPGDVDTPLYLTTTDVDLSARKVVFATRRRGTPDNMTWFRQAEDTALAIGVDTTRVADSAASDGLAARIDFATQAGSALRLSGAFPAGGGGSVDWRGTYRVFARLKQGSSAATIRVQVATGTSAAARNLPVTLNPAGFLNFVLYDLGLVHLPAGNTGVSAGYGPEHPVGASTLYLYAERTAGSGTLAIDYLFLCPADEDYGLVQFPQIISGSGAVVDGPNGEVYARNASSELSAPALAVPYVDGTLPTVSPLAVTNRVFVLNGVESPTNTPVTGAVTFTGTIWPRYRIIRPVST